MSNVLCLHSEAMSNKKEANVVRASNKLRDSLGVEVGDLVSVGGTKMYIDKAYPVDTERSESSLFFSNLDFGNLQEHTFNISAAPPNKITIGCDPEFVLTHPNGSVTDASIYLPHKGKLGSDGTLGELRPNPSDNSAEVMRNLQSLLKYLPSKTDKTPLAASYYKGFVSGFHVHLGIPQILLKYPNEESVIFIRNIIKTLDYFVGIPCAAFEDTDQRRRSNSEYAKPGDFRITEHTLEYRYPGGFFLKHPVYARSLLDACYTVVEDIIGRAFLLTRAFTDMSKFYSYKHFKDAYNLLDYKDTAFVLNSCGKNRALSALDGVQKSYEKLYGYKNNEKFIYNLFAPAENFGGNLLDNWQ